MLDPEKPRYTVPDCADLILVGGSTLPEGFDLDAFIRDLRMQCPGKPIWLFPGNERQVSAEADAMLYLSLLSGRNPEYLIGQHVRSARAVRESGVAVYPTGYILIDGGTRTSTMRVTETQPIPADDVDMVVRTAMAAELLGMRYVYLEAGSGAIRPVAMDLIRAVCESVRIPVIVGGGIHSRQQMQAAYEAGATMVVVGNWLETHDALL